MESDAGGQGEELSAAVVEASQPFVGRWDRLVSRTNWEKGRIVHEWREALVAADAPVQEYSDEAWSRLVGFVTPQHIGRLRRTFARFFETYESYEGLFWSHFNAAVDWNDAELWLEGAVQNGWSVNAMRRERWDKLGRPADGEPQAGDVVPAEVDEDAAVALGATTEVRDPKEFDGEASSRRYDEADFGDEDETAARENGEPHAEEPALATGEAELAAVRPFENLAAFPADLQEAFESFKLAILHHKLSAWQAVSATDVVAALRALEQMALAPS
jgi:hypothetical protein